MKIRKNINIEHPISIILLIPTFVLVVIWLIGLFLILFTATPALLVQACIDWMRDNGN